MRHHVLMAALLVAVRARGEEGASLGAGERGTKRLIDARPYNVICDGTTDTSAALERAVTAASGATLQLPEGVCVVRNVNIANPVAVIGAGQGRTTLKMRNVAAQDGSPLLSVRVGGVTLSDLDLDGNKAGQPRDGFSDSWAGGPRGQGRSFRALVRAQGPGDIAGLVVEKCGLYNAYGAGIATRNVSNVIVRNCHARGNNFEAVFVSADVTVSSIEVAGNDIRNTGSGDPAVNGNAILLNHVNGATVRQNRIEVVERNGVKCEFCSSTTIAENVVTHNSVPNFGGFQLQGDASNVTIWGNVAREVGAGITLNNTGEAQVISVVGNTIDGTHGPAMGDGISLASSAAYSGILIAGNVLAAVQRDGIYVTPSGGIANLSIVGNTWRNPRGPGAAGIVLHPIGASFSAVSISGNVLESGNTTMKTALVSLKRTGKEGIADLSVTGNVLIAGAGGQCLREDEALVSRGQYTANTCEGEVIRAGAWNSELRGTVTYDIAPIPGAACAADIVMTVPGAVIGSECVAGGPPGVPHSLSLTCYVSATNTATLRVCNNSGQPIDPPLLTYSARVLSP